MGVGVYQRDGQVTLKITVWYQAKNAATGSVSGLDSNRGAIFG